MRVTMSSFQEARDALVETIHKVFPDAKPAPRWANIETWGWPRPESVVDPGSTGTYDPKLVVIGIADRKSGPTIYFLDPGDYYALDTHRALLVGAGLKLGRGCIMHTRKTPLPVDALETLFRRVKERDERTAAGGAAPPKAKPTREKPTAKADAPDGSGAAAVEAYLAALSPVQRAALERLRAHVLAAAPTATQKMAYGMPTFVHAGRPLVHMAAFRDHCSFFPGSGGVTLALQDELARYDTGKGTIRFAPETPLPAALVKRIVKMRVAENEASAATKRKKAAAERPPAERAATKAAKQAPKKATPRASSSTGRRPRRSEP